MMVYILLIIIIIIIIFYVINNLLSNNEYFETKNKNIVCCFYAYYEKNDLYKNNFEHFLENALLDNIDYYIIINGECSVNIPDMKNIIVYKRENKGYDFGAYAYAIQKLNQYNFYKYYIFLNATVKGPYLNNTGKNWLDTFLELFVNNIKLVGTSVCYTEDERVKKIFNVDSIYFVQTMFFIINKDFFDYLNKENFFDDEELLNNETELQNIVINKEIKLSYLAYLSGGNINCYLSRYRNLDFANLKKDINLSSFRGDPYFPNRYFCSTIIPEDVIFYKNKRFIEDIITLKNELESDSIKNICNK